VFHRILVPFDASGHARRALDQASELARLTHARLTVMMVRPDVSALELTGTPVLAHSPTERQREIEDECRRTLDAALATVDDDLPVTGVLTCGDPGVRIVEQVASGEHDLVVMGSRGQGELRSLVLGSVSHHVVRESPAPVLVLRASDQDTTSPALGA
jgi:nucleotide-binding universal stress UspA family protein